jgi:nucleoside-diphosphate-sugar epimerase
MSSNAAANARRRQEDQLMKVLVTGAAGYIGSILVPRLLEEGHEVLAVDNFMYRQTTLLDCCANKSFTMVRGDARDPALLDRLIAKADAIIPLACLTGAPLCSRDPVGAKSIIFDAVKEILARRSRSQIIIYPTTNSGYGIGEKGKFCTEETPLRPISLYGRLKADVESEILAAGNAITFRLATVFGVSPRMRTDLLVNDFVLRAVRDRYIVLFEAHFKRNYLHIRDAADAFLHCLTHFEPMKNQAYNVGLSEANLSKYELCEEIKKQLPEFHVTESEVGQDPDKRDYIVSNAKIEAAGFKARRGLQEGISELIKASQILPAQPFGNV